MNDAEKAFTVVWKNPAYRPLTVNFNSPLERDRVFEQLGQVVGHSGVNVRLDAISINPVDILYMHKGISDPFVRKANHHE